MLFHRLISLAALVWVLLACAGCVSAYDRLDRAIPDGEARHLKAVVTGKFSSTTIEAENFVKTPEEVTASRLHQRHSNAWVPLIEITVDGYKRKRK